MRRLRLSLVGTVILMLLGGLSGAVLAQDEELAVKATHVTGTTTANRTVDQATYTMEGAHNTGYGGVFERDVEWSDARLPSMMRLTQNWDWYNVGESDGVNGALTVMQNVRLDDPAGTWVGTVYALLEETTPVERYPQTTLMVLEGEGAYEGLSAMFRTVYDEPPGFGVVPDWEGYILEGPMTLMPESPDLPAE